MVLFYQEKWCFRSPMNNAIEFKSPKQYEIVMKLSSGKVIKGMGIPKALH